jgi:hypothetical protein
MLPNYIRDENNVIRQIEKQGFVYDQSYVNMRYDSYGVQTEFMSHLRLGYIIGALGYVPEKILDVGYGNASFLKTCSSVIKNCYGHDISGYPLPNNITFVADIFKDSYDVVTFFDSLEHYDNPYFLKQLNTKYVCISLPWCHYVNDDWFDKWKHRRPNEHLWHFDDSSLKKFMESQGYECINTCNIEDTIRKSSTTDLPNILTGTFKKIS